VPSPALVQPSALDSSRFGFAIGRATLAPGEAARAIEEADALELDMLIARCGAADRATTRDLLDAGARFMDAELHFRAAPADLHELEPAMGVELRGAGPADEVAIGSVAEECFRGYGGHYHADPRLDPNAADAAYVDWALRCARGEAADLTLVAVVGAEVVGFSAFRLNSDREAQLVLGAVLRGAAGRQLYGRLTLAGAAWAGEQGRLSLLCVTQLGNLAAQRSWARVGLQPSAAFYTFHLWRR